LKTQKHAQCVLLCFIAIANSFAATGLTAAAPVTGMTVSYRTITTAVSPFIDTG
jgi:hypothetical protein